MIVILLLSCESERQYRLNGICTRDKKTFSGLYLIENYQSIFSKTNNNNNNTKVTDLFEAHPSCLELTTEMIPIIRTYQWQCMECKACVKCNEAHDEVSKYHSLHCYPHVHHATRSTILTD